jgi:hypothetical protein
MAMSSNIENRSQPFDDVEASLPRHSQMQWRDDPSVVGPNSGVKPALLLRIERLLLLRRARCI